MDGGAGSHARCQLTSTAWTTVVRQEVARKQFIIPGTSTNLLETKSSWVGFTSEEHLTYNYVGQRLHTAIPLPINLYVALRVGAAVILSQPPTSGTRRRVFNKSFLWGNLRFGGCFEKPSLQALFWCKKLRSGQKIGKVTKRRRSVKPTCANGGTNRCQRWDQCKFLYIGRFSIFPGVWPNLF